MSLWKEDTYNSSSKQKFDTKSSTVAELVAVEDVMAQVLRTIHDSTKYVRTNHYNISGQQMHKPTG